MLLTFLISVDKHPRQHTCKSSPDSHPSFGKMLGKQMREPLRKWVKRIARRFHKSKSQPSTTKDANSGIPEAHPFLYVPTPDPEPPSSHTVRYNIWPHRLRYETDSEFTLRKARLHRANLFSLSHPTHPFLARVHPSIGNIVKPPSSAHIAARAPKRPAKYVKQKRGLLPRCDIDEDPAGELLATSESLPSSIMTTPVEVEVKVEEIDGTALRGRSFDDDVDWEGWTKNETRSETQKRLCAARALNRKRAWAMHLSKQPKAGSTLSFLGDRSATTKKTLVERSVPWLDLHPNQPRAVRTNLSRRNSY